MEDTNSLSELKPTIQEDTKHTPNNPPWGVLAALGVFVLSVVLIIALPGILILPYLLNQGIKGNAEELESMIYSDTTAVVIALSATFLAHVLTMIAAWFVVTKVNKHSFKEMLGWNWGGFKFWHGLIILISVFALAIGLSSLLGNHENDLTKLLESSRVAVYIVAFIATFSAPIVEEVVYRGILYSAFQKALGVAGAVVIVTFLFAIVHVPQYYPDAAVIITILVLSLLITLIRVKTNNLLPCIAFHFVFNGIQSALLILQPYLPEAIAPLETEKAFFWFLM